MLAMRTPLDQKRQATISVETLLSAKDAEDILKRRHFFVVASRPFLHVGEEGRGRCSVGASHVIALPSRPRLVALRQIKHVVFLPLPVVVPIIGWNPWCYPWLDFLEVEKLRRYNINNYDK